MGTSCLLSRSYRHRLQVARPSCSWWYTPGRTVRPLSTRCAQTISFCPDQVLAVVRLVVGKERPALADDECTGQHFVGLLVVSGEGDHIPTQWSDLTAASVEGSRFAAHKAKLAPFELVEEIVEGKEGQSDSRVGCVCAHLMCLSVNPVHLNPSRFSFRLANCPPLPTIKWSRTSISINFPASTIRSVTCTSSGLASTEPLG